MPPLPSFEFNCLSTVYKKAIGIWVLALYPRVLISLLTSGQDFFLLFSDCLINDYVIYKQSFISSLLNWHAFYFLFLVCCTGWNSRYIIDKDGERHVLAFFLILARDLLCTAEYLFHRCFGVLLFWERVSTCSTVWMGIYFVAQDGLEFFEHLT